MKKIKLCLKVEFKIDELRDAIAKRFPLVKLDDNELEKVFVESLQPTIYKNMPEDINWRIKNDDYFKDLYVRLNDLQKDAEELLAEKESVIEWERGYWKDVGAA